MCLFVQLAVFLPCLLSGQPLNNRTLWTNISPQTNNDSSPIMDQFWSRLVPYAESWAKDNRSTVDQFLAKAGHLALSMGSGVENLQKNINIDHRDISTIFNNIVPNVYWTANCTALDIFPEMPDVEDIFPVIYWGYNCSAEYHGHTKTTLFCAVQDSWQDMARGVEHEIGNVFDFLVKRPLAELHHIARYGRYGYGRWYGPADLLDKILYTPLSQAVSFFNNLVPCPSSNSTIIGDYLYHGYSNRTIFGDNWSNFKANWNIGSYWENMLGTTNMTSSNYTWY